MNKEVFVNSLQQIGISINNKQLDDLDLYYNLLIEWNEKINLTTITKKEDVYLKHFYDCLTIYKEYNLKRDISICDVGTGAGFPGIVLKILFPNLKITLVDSLQKRINFLDNVVRKLNLKNVELIHERMEDYSRKNVEKFDLITSRAVAKTNILVELSIKSLKIDGHLILMKSSFKEEIINAEKIIKETGGVIDNINIFKLPVENSERALINIKKIKKTPDKYPRSIDKIKKSL